MKIEYLGHSCFLIYTGKFSLLIDPFISENPSAKVHKDIVVATHIFVTHAHSDHIGDAVEITQRCNATVFATVETANLFPKSVNVEVGQIGGSVSAEFGQVKFTSAVHGSGVAGGLSCGFLIEAEGLKIYHAGDTGLIMDMALLEDDMVDIALLPIGDRYTMGPKDALRAVKMIKPVQVIPMHYNTMPDITQDPHEFKIEVETKTAAKVLVLGTGDSVELFANVK